MGPESQEFPEQTNFEEAVPLDSILSEPLTHPLHFNDVKLPALPPPLPAVQPPAPATPGSLWRDSILDLLASFAVTGVVAVIYVVSMAVAIGMGEGDMGSLLSPWAIAALLIATQIPLYAFARRRLARNQQKGRPVPALFAGPAPQAIAWGIAAGLTLALLSSLYTAALQRFFGDEYLPQQLEFLRDIAEDRLAVIVLIGIVTIMAPICEELFFRGAIFASARSVGLSGPGAVVSAVLFATVHLSAALAPFYALFALVMCWLYVRTRTLLAPMSAHFTMNALACIALIVQNSGEVI